MKHSKIVLFFVVGTILAVYGRWSQIFFFTEAQTGFFIADYSAIAKAISLLIFLICVVAAAFSLFTHRVPKGAPKNSRVAVVMYILAAAFLFEGIFVTYDTLLGTVTRIVAILSAVCIVLYAFFGKSEKPVASRLGGLLAVPVVFFILKTLTVFVLTSRLSATASVVFRLLSLCAMTVFMFLFAKLENELSVRKTAFLLFPSSIICAILGYCCSIPQVLALVMGKSTAVKDDMISTVLSLVMAAFATVYMISLYDIHNIKVSSSRSRTHSLKSDKSADDIANEFYSGGN